MWIEQPGSPDFEEGSSGTARLIRFFHAAVNAGKAEAKSQGYKKGDSLRHEGYYLKLVGISARNVTGADEVKITWTTPQGFSRGSSNVQYNEGRIRNPGDEQWRLEASLDQLPAEDAVDYQGNQWSGTWGVERDKPVLQPDVYLVWRKWLDKNRRAPILPPTTLPERKADALVMANTYIPGGNEKYERNPPRLMSLLNSYFMCVHIEIEEDGDLVCRIARFKYKKAGWNTNIYGPTL